MPGVVTQAGYALLRWSTPSTPLAGRGGGQDAMIRETTRVTAGTFYGADDLTHLEGLEAVRKRPGMYIGSTDSRGINHLFNEVVDNSTDEGIGGHAKRITVIL